MRKITKLILLLTILTISSQQTFSSNIPVERVFDDIDSNYEYHDELQALYDREIILPNVNWKLEPYSLVKKDDFISISMESSCEKCELPHTDYNYI